ncbi:MAG: formylmethanofuran dehydrogenase subunit E family protein [Candidatus Bathyarchaeota archaeon]|nr:formylmethanofuran dehydrogenase subunit E family protein [Candidatus Bathyarchaeota archaeon]
MLVSQKILEGAVKLHGHLGPFLVIGLRMSLLAEKVLGGKPTMCEVKVMKRKPRLCAVDGIKAVIGSDAIVIKKGSGIAAKFSRAEDEWVILRVKKSVVERFEKSTWEKCEEDAQEVLRSRNEDLFERISS